MEMRIHLPCRFQQKYYVSALTLWFTGVSQPNLFFDRSANHPGLALPFCKPQGETHQGHPTMQMLQGLWLASGEQRNWFAGQITTVRNDTHPVVVFATYRRHFVQALMLFNS
jgi:hypothetical protein